MLSGLEGSVVVTLGANQAAARIWRCYELLLVGVCVVFGFFSWEQENEQRQPSKGHFPRDQEMILQIYGLQREEKESWQLCCVLSYC